jgi:RNA polymerase sigma-70 factor (ECF subfamily)
MSNQASKVSSEDEELVRRIRSNESAAEEELVQRFQRGLLAIAHVRVGREYSADLVQETLAVALPNLRRGDWKAAGPLSAYLATILRRMATRLRSGLPHVGPADNLEGLPAADLDPLAAAEKAQARERTREALGKLSPRHREVLLLHYFEGLTADEIARELEIPRGTVLSRLFHAKRKVSRTMNRWRPGSRG